MCVAANLKIPKFEEGEYSDFRQIIDNTNLEEAIRSEYFPGSSDIAKHIAGAVRNDQRDWKVKRVGEGDLAPLIFKCDKKAVVCFPGTPPLGIGVWLKDANALLSGFTTSAGCACSVHKGFLGITNGVKDAVAKELGDLGCDDIEICGYSAGAAVAMLFALGLKDEIKNKISCMSTFASPRIGNRAFARGVRNELNGKIRDIRNSGDIVPSLPPAFTPSIDDYILIDGKTNAVNEEPERTMQDGIWKEFRSLLPASIFRAAESLNPVTIVNKHFPVAYFNGLCVAQETGRVAFVHEEVGRNIFGRLANNWVNGR